MKFKNKELMVIRGGSPASPPVMAEPEVAATAPSTLLLPASLAAAPHQATPGMSSGLENGLPLWRSTDSLPLLGESGVVQVGVNDLGWVVYDWIPGP